jgi:hypothetical protein
VYLKPLYDLMEVCGFTELMIRELVADKGFVPFTMPLENYREDVVAGALVGQWDKMLRDILPAYLKNRVPF